MIKEDIDNYFQEFLEQEPLFIDKAPLQSQFTPEEIPHREEQIKQIATILAPLLRVERPSNIFMYGKTGTGKTLSIKHTTNKIQRVAQEKHIPLKVIYLNCKLKRVADTEYRLIAELARECGKEIPPTGLPTDEVYKIFYSAIDDKKQAILLVLDEIDQLIQKAGDELLYNLTRINSELNNAQISIVGISNNLLFTENIDPRVKSSLSEEEILFPPYNALQIQNILKSRCSLAFKEGVVGPGVIAKCAAYAAREHGDARRALDLMRVAGELAEREQAKQILVDHIDKAEEKIEKDRVLDIVQSQPKQFQATLFAILSLTKQSKKVATGDIYSLYMDLCAKIGLRPLTQRRISDIIAELDMLGIINAKIISKGRYGRTREISVAITPSSENNILNILKKELDL
ncbi:ORC1-type DNA replication protein [Candidatus Woesearchaeota archaeon]|nr:MAG: ORC1-type DNA replication protein [Candidatus Woesearchaeota archaeon]